MLETQLSFQQPLVQVIGSSGFKTTCTPGMSGDLDTIDDNSTCQINIDLSKFNGKVLNIRYDGEMNNLPGYYDRGQNTFYRLINPKDGAIFTNMADAKTYKYKALGIDEVFVPEPNAASCSCRREVHGYPYWICSV